MSKYDSLAEQVSEDFRMTMLAMSDMREALRRANKGIRRTYRTIRQILRHQQEQDGRLDALEQWQQSVSDRLSA